MILPAGLATIAARLDDCPADRGALAFCRAAAGKVVLTRIAPCEPTAEDYRSAGLWPVKRLSRAEVAEMYPDPMADIPDRAFTDHAALAIGLHNPAPPISPEPRTKGWSSRLGTGGGAGKPLCPEF